MYHVTLRGNHRQDIFFTSDDRSLLTHVIRDVLVDCGARLHAYCYMTNHVHALLQVSNTPLSKIMLLVAGRYERRVQARLETTGHLFEKRYHALLVDADEYLLALLRYIHLNPVRASLVSSPDEYPWSSHHAYVGRRSEPWVTTEFALRMLGSDRRRAMAAYETLINWRMSTIGLAFRRRNAPETAEIFRSGVTKRAAHTLYREAVTESGACSSRTRPSRSSDQAPPAKPAEDEE